MHMEDVGIGGYTFWGAGFTDNRILPTSDCCSGDVYDDPACTILHDPTPDLADYGDYD